ncbi:MAG: methionyl-tRNA formyltransferase [Bacteroidia bacterium]|nr:methionyl-tRNA formyltransferase [Bacteroidia bacterium]
MRIVFFGTPDFAVASLKAIVKAGYEILAVVTAPDKPAGRGMHLHQSPVKQFAVANGLKVLQPVKLKDPQFIEELRSLHADLQVVIAFRMLPEIVWNMPDQGTINLHASLLPDYRGAAPINWAIINGEPITGVSTFFLKHEIDTGDILLHKQVVIDDEMNAGELHDLLMHVGSELIVQSLKLIETGHTHGTPQAFGSIKTAPKIDKQHCLINWEKTGKQIINLVRGMSPYPAANLMLFNKVIKIYKARFEPTFHEHENGTAISDDKTFLKIACKDGFVFLLDVQMESKKRMTVEEFLRGYRLPK